MTIKSAFFKTTLAVATSLPTLAMASGLYGTAQLGYSVQASDVSPYGNNIAVDKEFPSKFDNDDSVVGALGLGYQVNKNLRLEGRIGYRNAEYTDVKDGTGERLGHNYVLDGEVESATFTLEGFYDFPTLSALTPYVKAGVGVSKNTFSARLGGQYVAKNFDAYDGKVDGYYDNYKDGKETNFSWNVGVGASYNVSPETDMFAEYQYANFGDLKTEADDFTDGFKVDNASAHEMTLGFRYKF